MQAIPYRKDIDALRGVSVTLVIIFHAFPNLIPGGFIGVDVFFVISGYLITQIILNSINSNDFSLLEFYSRRIRRLFPALITVLLAALFAGWLVLFPDEYEQLANHAAYSAIYVLNYIFIGEVGYFDVENVYKPLLHLWTLSVEEQYYIIWPLLLMIGLKQNFIKPVYIISLLTLASFIGNIYFIDTYPDNVYFNTLTRVWQLALGSLLGVFLANKILKERKYLLLSGLTLILISAFSIDDATIYPGWIAIFPTAGAMLIIMGNVKFRRWGGMVNIGVISYPLYLWHWLAISFLYIYIGQSPGAMAMTITILISFLLAFLTHRYIEKLRYVKGSHITVVLLLSMASIGLAGAYVKNNNGFPERNHLSYLDNYNIEFKRTAMIDSHCDEYSNNILYDDRLFDYCRASNLDAKKYIAVIGDSHAHAIYPGIAEQAWKRGYGALLLANSSCPTLIGFLWGKNPKEVQDCKERIEQIFEIISSDIKIKKILMVTRGPVYIHGEVEGVFTIDSVNKNLSVIKQEKQSYQTYFNGFRNTLERLQQIKHIDNIFYFLENPELDFLPKEAVVRPFDVWGISIQEATMEKDLYLLRMRQYRDMAANQENNFRNLKIIDPMPYLCDSDRCFSYKNNNYLYADDDHFSVFGSKYIAKNISGVIFDE